MKYTNNKVQLAVAHSRHREALGPIKLQLSHLEGSFVLLGYGIAVSVVAFVVEVVIGMANKKRQKRGWGKRQTIFEYLAGKIKNIFGALNEF